MGARHAPLLELGRCSLRIQPCPPAERATARPPCRLRWPARRRCRHRVSAGEYHSCGGRDGRAVDLGNGNGHGGRARPRLAMSARCRSVWTRSRGAHSPRLRGAAPALPSPRTDGSSLGAAARRQARPRECRGVVFPEEVVLSHRSVCGASSTIRACGRWRRVEHASSSRRAATSTRWDGARRASWATALQSGGRGARLGNHPRPVRSLTVPLTAAVNKMWRGGLHEILERGPELPTHEEELNASCSPGGGRPGGRRGGGGRYPHARAHGGRQGLQLRRGFDGQLGHGDTRLS